MKVVLELQDQPSNIKRVTIRHDIVIGRGADCNLRLSAPQVSRRHCFLRISSEGAFVSDLDSSNGTVLNGEKLTSGQRYQLDDGAILAIGPVKFEAKVQSEVIAGEMLEINGDHRIEAEPSRAIDDSQVSENFDATMREAVPENSGESLNFAVEQAGPSADDDDPTADCLVTDRSHYDLPDEVPPSSDEPLLSDMPFFDDDDPETIAQVMEDDVIDLPAEAVELIDDDADDIVEVFDVLAEDEDSNADVLTVAEVVDDSESVDVVEDDDVVEIVDDDEVLLLDDDMLEMPGGEKASDNDIMIVESEPDYESGDRVEDELRDFLGGLD